jgi:hypothetical protein
MLCATSHLKPMLNALCKTTAAATDLRVRDIGACLFARAGMRDPDGFAVCVRPAESGVNVGNNAT